MSHIALLPYGPSESVTALRDSLRELGHSVVQMRREGSTFRPRQGQLIINYGNRNPDSIQHNINANNRGAIFLNNSEAISLAVNKVNFFNSIPAEIPHVEFTVSREQAQNWHDEGYRVYARTVLNGHSGEGIVIIDSEDDMVDAPLYTKGITAQRREFRVHVMKGKIVYVQQKKRREGAQELPEYSEKIRNHSTGWIYATSDIRPNQACLDAAVRIVSHLGLDFGAVDLITRRDDAWVLEVNTAPGLTGTTLETYRDNFIRISNGEEPIEWVVENATINAVPTEQPVPDSVQEPVQETVVPTTPQSSPTPDPITEPISTPVPEHSVSASVTLRANRWYIVDVNGNRDIMKYFGGCFWSCGVEIGIERHEVEVLQEVSLS